MPELHENNATKVREESVLNFHLKIRVQNVTNKNQPKSNGLMPSPISLPSCEFEEFSQRIFRQKIDFRTYNLDSKDP
jgi:hypothetical protein